MPFACLHMRKQSSHFERALNLMQELHQIPVTVERELRLRLALGAPLLAARGFGDQTLAGELHASPHATR